MNIFGLPVPHVFNIFDDFPENANTSSQQMHYLIPQLDSEFVKVINPSPAGPWICGGACLRWYQGQHITDSNADIDVYVTSDVQYKHVTELVGKLNGASVEVLTDNAVTYTINNNGRLLKVQIITKHLKENFTNISELLETFDMSVCKIGFDGVEFHIASPYFHSDVRQRLIRMDGPPKKGAFTRLIKYMAQGYKPIPGLFSDLLDSDEAMEPVPGGEYD